MNRPALLLTILLSAALAVFFTAAPASAADPAVEKSAHAGDAHGADTKGSFPPKPNEALITAITTLVIFGLLVVVLGKVAWGPIASGLQAREDKIRKDIADAEAARDRAEATLKEYSVKLASAQEQIRQMIGQAQKDAEGVAAGIKVKAQQEAEEIKERATKEIDASKNAALAEIHEHTATLATSVAEKILRRNINDGDHRALVQSSLEQLQAAGRN
jgi:F-type H+-transporting ATPase subunit b